jgi:NADH pyrophosphatase NudC (nudix superfamily)
MEKRKMSCDFCKRFDFSSAKIEVDKYNARILLALCDTKFDKTEQFNFCPKCGHKLPKENNKHTVQMVCDNYDVLHNPKVKEKYPTLEPKMAFIDIRFQYEIPETCQQFLQTVQDEVGELGIKIEVHIG